jgi:uncharacterized membrane protein
MPKRPWTDERVEIFIGNLLRVGVIVAAAVVVFGGALYLIRHGREPTPDRQKFVGEPPEFCSVKGTATEASHISARGIIQLGLLLIIAVPVLRVAFSVWAFWQQRDRLYVGITLLVLAILCFSLLSGTGG